MRKSGFTLVEIMLAIAIIGIMALLSTNFNFNKKSSIEKGSRMITKISSMIKTEIFNSQAGRSINFGSGIMSPDYTEIHIGTGNLSISYIGTKTLTGEIFNYPFFGEKPYIIKDIHLIEKDGSTGAIVNPFSAYITNSAITFSGSNAIKLSITAGYSLDYKTLELDRRTGIIEIK